LLLLLLLLLLLGKMFLGISKEAVAEAEQQTNKQQTKRVEPVIRENIQINY